MADSISLSPGGVVRFECDRLGINCRVTTFDTLVYPDRLKGRFLDGSNLDISLHQCALLSW